MAVLNLAQTAFVQAGLWGGLLSADEFYYQGVLADKMQYFKVIKAAEPSAWLTVNVIRREEDYIWESARDLIDRAVKQAATVVRGVYSFELLAFEAHKELKTFNFNELAQVLVNSTRILKPGDQVLIKYSSVYGLLQKVGEEAWGKMVLKTSVEWASDQPKFVFALFTKMFKVVESFSFPTALLLNDLGTRPLFDPPNSEEQQALLDEFMAKRAKTVLPFKRELYVRDVTGVRRIYG